MSQHIIGQMEKRDMRIYVGHISNMTLLKHTVTDGEEDGEDEDIISYQLGTINNLFENAQNVWKHYKTIVSSYSKYFYLSIIIWGYWA